METEHLQSVLLPGFIRVYTVSEIKSLNLYLSVLECLEHVTESTSRYRGSASSSVFLAQLNRKTVHSLNFAPNASFVAVAHIFSLNLKCVGKCVLTTDSSPGSSLVNLIHTSICSCKPLGLKTHF